MAIERLSVVLELISGNYERNARNAANATGQIGNSAKSVTGQLGAMLGPAAIGGAILGLGKMALAAGENADRLFDLQAQTGLSTDALQQWEFVAKAAGAETEVFSDAVKAIVKNLSEAANGTGAAASAYERLGVSVKDANGNIRAGGEITAEVFDKLAGMANITERNALAQDIFGKKWEETISILDLGTEALGNLREEGKKGVVSAEALRNADKFRESWQKFMATVGPKLNEILGKIAPSLTEIAEEAANAVEEIAPFVEQIVTLAGWVLKLRGDTDDLSESQSGFNRFIGDGIDVLEGMINPLKAWDNLMGVLNPKVEENVAVVGEVHDSWRLAATAAISLSTAIGPTIAMLDNQNTSHRNAARAADTQRRAMINLFNAQDDLLDPIRSVLLLQTESVEANKRLADAQANTKTTSLEMSLALIEAEQAQLRLNGAAAALTADQIQAFAITAQTELGLTDREVLDLLDSLHLLDGTNVDIAFTFSAVNASLLKAINNTSGGEISINDIQVRQHGGPVRRGRPYLVGEAGPELMVPSQSGMIIPNGQLGGFSSSPTFITKYGPTITVLRPMDNFQQDLQHATILASLTNLVEGF